MSGSQYSIGLEPKRERERGKIFVVVLSFSSVTLASCEV
jgi:hypothetical protein